MHAVRWLASPRQGEKALLNDFWYFWSYKSTIKEKLLYAKDNTSSVSLWLTPSPTGEGSLPAFSFEEEGAKEKATKKKTPKKINFLPFCPDILTYCFIFIIIVFVL